MYRQAVIFVGIILVIVAIVLVFILPIEDKAGWIQVILAVVGVPAIFIELIQLRRAIEQTPTIQLGLATVEDLPVASLRSRGNLSATVTVSRGYAHFFLVLKNAGEVGISNVKIQLEHIRSQREVDTATIIKVSEFSESKPTFFSENNFDFTFWGGADWMIYPGDSELFGFHITTAIYIQDDRLPEKRRPSYPPAGKTNLRCTVWAKGLKEPVEAKLVVVITEHPNLIEKL
jgi:hypothetical protein